MGTTFDVDELILTGAELALIEDPFLPARERAYAHGDRLWEQVAAMDPWELRDAADDDETNYRRPMFEVLPDVDCHYLAEDAHGNCLSSYWSSAEATVWNPLPALRSVRFNVEVDVRPYMEALNAYVQRWVTGVSYLDTGWNIGPDSTMWRIATGTEQHSVRFTASLIDEAVWAAAVEPPTTIEGIVARWDITNETALARTGDLPLDLTARPEPADGPLRLLTPSPASVWSSEPFRPVREPFAHRGTR